MEAYPKVPQVVGMVRHQHRSKLAMMCLAWRIGAAARRTASGTFTGWSKTAWVVAGALGLGVWTAGARAQETCQTASPIPVGQLFVANNSAAGTDGPAGLCTATARDVWHTFVPSVGGQHTISLCGSAFDTVVEISAGCGVEPIDCSDDSCGLQSQMVVNLNAGQTYILRIAASAATGGAGGAYRVQITPPSAAPANNVCGSGSVLPPNTVVSGSNAGATGTDVNGGCGGSNDRNDVWYSFNPAASGLHIVALCSTAFDGVLSVHSSCFNAQLLGCNDDDSVDGCPNGSGSRIGFVATAGTPVLIRVAGVNGGFGPYSLVIYTAQPNDLCQSPRPIVRGVPFSGNITPALSTEGEAGCAPSALDTWHSFVASSTAPHLFSLCGSEFDTVLSVHRGCPGESGFAELACSDDGCAGGGSASELVLGLTVGELYMIRVAGRTTAGGTLLGPYTLRVDLAAPGNDSCDSPVALATGVPVTGVTYGATGSDQTTCGVNDAHDVWYSFTPDQNGVFEFNTCGSSSNTTLALFSDCQNEITCSDDDPVYCGSDLATGSRILRLLSSNVTYLVRVATIGIDGPFRLVVNQTPPSNDQCGNAAPLSLGVPAAVTLSGALPTGFDACGAGDTPDAYFSFTPSQSRFYRLSTCGSAARTTLSTYATCPPAALLSCSTTAQSNCSGGRNTDLSMVMRAGMTHRIRVAAASDQSPAGFQALVEAIAPPNDDCSRATPMTPEVVMLASNVGAGGSEITPCGAGDTRDVWFQFVPPLSGNYEFRTCAPPPGDPTPDTTLALFDACEGSLLLCNDDAPAGSNCAGAPMLSAFTTRLEIGRTYLLRASIVGGGEGVFSISVRAPRPANDICSTAQTVIDGLVTFDNLGADSDPTPMSGCGLGFSTIQNDLWYRYIPASPGPVVVSSCGTGFDTAIAVLDGVTGCGGMASVVACNDDYDCDQSPLTPDTASRAVFEGVTGRPYLIRVGSLHGERGAGELRISRGSGLSCPCDWNRRDGRTVQDVFDFLVSWFSGQGDFNQSGSSDLQDLFDFLACYLGATPGCG